MHVLYIYQKNAFSFVVKELKKRFVLLLLVFCIPPETSPEETYGPEPSPRQAVFFVLFLSGSP